jgi:hypothetical protein
MSRPSETGGFCRLTPLYIYTQQKPPQIAARFRAKYPSNIRRNPWPQPRVLVTQGVSLIMRSLLATFRSLLLCSTSVLLAADLPVKQVTLYKHGIGYFERAGSVPSGEEVRLDFKNNDMNDVLKSLIVSDANGGKISGIRYDSNATLEQQLEKYPFTIGSSEMLSSFLDRLKGAHLEITVGDAKQTGAILGARPIAGAGQNRDAVNEQITLLLESGAISSFDLAAVRSMRLLDPQLEDQLKQYLQTVAQAKSKDKRSIYLDSNGSATRSLRLSYITPVAIWKSSYRLSLDAAAPRLEGWAIVDNTTDEDWSNVRLSVVSGRPISFVSLLDTPRYGNRQVAELPEDKAAGPVVYGGALSMLPSAGLTMQEQMAGAGHGSGTGGGVYRMGSTAQAPSPKVTPSFRQASDLISASSVLGATGATLGELFEYNFPGPVTIKKNQSAMLPFLQDKIAARKLLIYQQSDGGHPVNAAEVTNTTSKTLDGGPITVYDGGAYAGEALVETFKAGDKRLIGYAVDYGTLVATDSGAGEKILREVSAREGILTLRSALRATTTYTIKNVDPKPKTLIVQQNDANYTVLSPKPIERTVGAYRFEVHLPANGSQELKVEQEQLVSEETAVTNASPDSLADIIQNRSLTDAGRRALEAIVDLKTKIVESQATLDGLRTRNVDLADEQSRLRQNIDSLNRVKGQEDKVSQYSSQLAANEAALAKLRDQRDAEAQRKKTLDTELRGAIATLRF